MQRSAFSFQLHEIKDEIMLVRTGHIMAEINSEIKHYSPGEMIFIPRQTIHRIEAMVDSCIYEFSTNFLDDIIRISDDFGRVEKKV